MSDPLLLIVMFSFFAVPFQERGMWLWNKLLI